MDEPQEIRTPDGGVLVVLSKSEYEALREAAEDAGLARLAAQARAELACRDDELIPIELHDRLSAGENPIQVWREHRGMTLAALARAAGARKADLEDIEKGSTEPTLRTSTKIARALRLDLEDLLSPAPAARRERSRVR